MKTCPLSHTDTFPAPDLCRSRRRDNRENYGLVNRECASCGRDLGAKTKDMGGRVSVRVSSGSHAPKAVHKAPKTAPSTKIQRSAKCDRVVTTPAGSRPASATSKPKERLHVPGGRPKGQIPGNHIDTSLSGHRDGQQTREGRATGKDAPHSVRYLSFMGGFNGCT